MIKALLLVDEKSNLDNLEYILTHDCNQVEICFKTTDTSEAAEWLSHHTIDVLFLDIEMPKQNGFEFLQSIGHRNFQVVFVTAYDTYSLKAIKAGALDYLLNRSVLRKDRRLLPN